MAKKVSFGGTAFPFGANAPKAKKSKRKSGGKAKPRGGAGGGS